MNLLCSQFADRIDQSLKRNGFPEKRVSLPLEQLQRAAASQGVELSAALALLEPRGVTHEIVESRVLFSPAAVEAPSMRIMAKAKAFAEIFEGIDPAEFAALQGLGKIQLFLKLRKLAAKIPAAKLARAQELFSSLSE